MRTGIIIGTGMSGGNNVIIEHCSRIHDRGNLDVYFIVDGDFDEETFNWQPLAKNIKKITFAQAQKIDFDILIASFWKTCYQLPFFTSKCYLYFNQGLEAELYPPENKNIRSYANATYLLDLNIITEVNWLKKHIKDLYDKDAELVLNGINKDNFKNVGSLVENKKEDQLRILIEGDVYSHHKNIKNTVEICKKSNADEIWLLTSSDIKDYPGVHKVFSKVPNNEVQKIYRSCDVLVKLSLLEGMFGPPLEMFHCGGTAISYNIPGHEEYMINNYNSIVVEKNNKDEVLKAINTLKENPSLLSKLKENALITASKWSNWDVASQNFEDTIIRCSQKKQISKNRLTHLTNLFTSWYQYSHSLHKENYTIKKKFGYKIHQKLKSIFTKL